MAGQNRIVRYSIQSLKIFSVIFVVLILLFLWNIRLSMPNIEEDIRPENYQREQIGINHYQIGDNYLRKNNSGIWEMYLEGDDYERGIIYGVLAKELMEKQEIHFVNQINEIVPNRFYLFFLKLFVGWFNRNLDEYVTDEYQREIYGVSKSFSEKYNYIAPKYYRILNYHAAHDIGHALKELNMVGCTSFAAKGSFTQDSSLLIARNFDFYMGDAFAEDKLLVFMNPTNGYPYMSYAWAGLMGAVSGMNTEGLSVTINASKSSLPTEAKNPISLLAREILQYAKNIEEAVAIAKKRQTFVSESLLIGSAQDNKAIIIEKTPDKIAVFDNNEDLLVCANHYQSDFFATDSININNIKNSDSKYRFDWMRELVKQNPAIDVQNAAEILRNKDSQDQKVLGYGNPKAINQLIAHHGIIFQPNDRKVWASTPPYQLGEFICYDLNTVFNTKKVQTIDSLAIAKDTFLISEDYQKYEAYKIVKQKIQKYVALDIPFEMTEKDVQIFINNNSNSYITYFVLGDYYNKKKNSAKAVFFYKKALEYEIASLEEKEKIQLRHNEIIN